MQNSKTKEQSNRNGNVSCNYGWKLYIRRRNTECIIMRMNLRMLEYTAEEA